MIEIYCYLQEDIRNVYGYCMYIYKAHSKFNYEQLYKNYEVCMNTASHKIEKYTTLTTNYTADNGKYTNYTNYTV